jgi:hypothetical protein
MVTFTVPVSSRQKEGAEAEQKQFRFSVPRRAVVLAGSRHLQLPKTLCTGLVHAFSKHGFSFFVGDAGGVGRSFRTAIAGTPLQEKTLVACAFTRRVEYSFSKGLLATKVVPDNLPPKAALHRRTVWMVKRCCMVLLFPEDPATDKWGKGSILAFKTALYHVKPVFVVSTDPPKQSVHYLVLPANLFGIIDGFWVVPHPYEEGGTCDEEW